MKSKVLIITIIAFFLIVNLNHFWEGKLGILAIPVFGLFLIMFLVLALIAIAQIVKAVNEKFENRNRNWTVGIMIVLLGLIFFRPTGLIDFDRFEGENILIAQREGAANCMTTFKIKPNNKFKERSVCFGVSEVNGDYKIKNDTIFFLNVNLPRGENKYYEFAVLQKSKYRNEDALFRFRTQADTIGNELWIIKNEILK